MNQRQNQRRKGREFALQCLYALEVGQGSLEDVEDKIRTGLRADAPNLEYGRQLTNLVMENVISIDDQLESASRNWSLGRLAVIDKILMRCALAEMLYLEDIPPRVSITEAVQLAVKYSTAESSKFINGILDGMAKKLSLIQ